MAIQSTAFIQHPTMINKQVTTSTFKFEHF